MKNILLSLSILCKVAALTSGNSNSNSNSNEVGIIEDLDDLVYDSNSKLLTHYLFYPAAASSSSHCSVIANWKEKNKIPYGYTVQPLTGDALKAVFPEDGYNNNSSNKASSCPVACVERGTDKSLVYAILPNKKFLPNDDDDDDEVLLWEWFGTNCLTVDVCLLNYYSWENPINVWWVDDSNEGGYRYHQMELEYGSENTGCFQSQIGHHFIVTETEIIETTDGEGDEEENENIIDDFIIEHNLFKAFGKAVGDPTGIDFEKQIIDTLQDNWDNHKEVRRTFSPLGFKKGRLPDDVYASMSSFYYNNRDNMAREEWTESDGPYVNWWEVDCSFIEIPRTLKLIWQERLRELVQAWAGVPIEQTDMYGMRQYNQGNRLLTHVDRVTTHAVSLIVNIAQGNLTKPWPVEINDHENRLHQFILEPGEILYYESAKCLHGRNQPLQGDNAYYVNLFTHYRPENDPYWYLKPNPPPETGEEEAATTTTPGNGGVCNQLDDKTGAAAAAAEGTSQECSKQGSNLAHESASDFRATSAADLVRWWRLTGEEMGDK